MQPGKPADPLSTTEVILRTPENMKGHKQSLQQASVPVKMLQRAVHFEDQDHEQDQFVEDMPLGKIDDLRQEADEWKGKSLALTVDHRRMSVKHAKQGDIARALKTDAARKLILEQMPTPTDVARSGRAHETVARWMDTAHAQGSLFYLEACSFCMRGYAAMFRRASSLTKSNFVLVSLYLMLHHEHYFAHPRLHSRAAGASGCLLARHNRTRPRPDLLFPAAGNQIQRL